MTAPDPEIPSGHISDFEPISQDVLSSIPVGLVRKNLIVPVAKENGRLKAVVPKTSGVVKPEGLQMVTGCPVDLVIVPVNEIVDFIKAHFPGDDPDGAGDLNVTSLVQAEPARPPETPSTPAVKKDEVDLMLERLVMLAVNNRATQILVQNKMGAFRFRFRIRGVWVREIPGHNWSDEDLSKVIDAIRAKGERHNESGMKWAEYHLNIEAARDAYTALFKLSETPQLSLLSIYVKHQSDMPYSPVKWGMDKMQAREFDALMSVPRGLVLFCGTSRDGISETVYSCLQHMASSERHVLSVELQITDWISSVNQLNANGKDEFFNDLISVGLSHMPEIMMVNPLDNKANFEKCLRSAMDGTVVLGQMPAFDSVDALGRLLSMNVDSYMLGFGLAGIVVQRAVRLNCSHCQRRDMMKRSDIRDMGISAEVQPPSFYKGSGCESCNHTGFGEEAHIFEICHFQDDFKTVLKPGMNISEIQTILRKFTKTNTLRQAAVRKAVSGQIALSEVIRISTR